MELELKLSQNLSLSPQMIQSIEILQMNALELESYVENLAQENPLVELPDKQHELEPELPPPMLGWLMESDYQNLYYYPTSEKGFDPLTLVGTSGGLEETLTSFLTRQIERLELPQRVKKGMEYLANCLEDSGYLQIHLEELAEISSFSTDELRLAHAHLLTLEPAGVGAESLSQCLAIQLERIGETGPALDIVKNHLPQLAHKHYRAIMQALRISKDEVIEAEQLIRELEPRPGAIFAHDSHTQYVIPDIIIEYDESGDTLQVRTRTNSQPSFRVSRYYRNLLSQTQEADVKKYLTQKLQQAEQTLRAIEQRESTLLRCARVIARRQEGFFRHGTQAMTSLSLADVARELEVHESTVSRAIREKYLQCPQGVYPLSYFFSRKLSENSEGEGASTVAAKELLRTLVEGEDKTRPLSDQKLADIMAEKGCPISRRTVAKYRDELGIASTLGRKQ